MPTFRIATRQSTMALAQTREVIARLQAAHPDLECEIAENRPRGDRDQVSRLDRHGGKGGAFVAEIRADVVKGRTQAAMHSLKDMPGNEEVRDLVIGAFLPRDDPTDSLVLRPGLTMDALRADGGRGFRLGTNSVRRAALIRTLLPQIEIIHFRGAADSRVAKLDAGEGQKLVDGTATQPADAILLATAGMARVGLAHRAAHTFPSADMLPAVGQGIVAVECAADDWATREMLARIDDAAARACADCERELLWVLDGHCNSPIAGHATIEGDAMRFQAAVMTLDGSTILRSEANGEATYPRELGRRVALDLMRQGAMEIISETRV